MATTIVLLFALVLCLGIGFAGRPQPVAVPTKIRRSPHQR
jgi:hypothetical protein